MGSWTRGRKQVLSCSFTFTLLVCTLQLVAAQSVNIQVNKDNDETHFEGQVFRRLCSILNSDNMGSPPPTFEWLRDGVPLMSGSGVNLQLHLSSLELSHSGHYMCRVTLDDGTVLGPISGGSLNVLDRSPINAPITQYVLYGSNTLLNCSYPEAFPTWRRNSTQVSSYIENASIADEGLYSCDLFVASNDATIVINVTVLVIVPVNITSRPQSFHEIRGNVPVSVDLAFSGRRDHNLTVTWFRNGSRLSSGLEDRIVMTNFSQLGGRTGLNFGEITRADQGVYRVVVASPVGVGALSHSLTIAEFSFQIDVIVPPSPPTHLEVDSTTSFTVDLTWRLTNRTADEGGDVLILNVTFANMTQAIDIIRLPGGQTEFRLEDLIPGKNYTVTLSAVNEDATVRAPLVMFSTLIGVPKVNEILIERVNETFFVATVSLAYTGGGNVTHFEISYKTVASISWIDLPDTTVNSSSRSSLVWSGLFEVPDEDVSLGVLDFQLRVVNQYGLKSQYRLGTASKFIEPTTTLVTEPVPTNDGAPLQLWVIIVIVAVASVALTVVFMIIVICTIYMCRRSQRNKRQYKVNIPTSNLNNSMDRELDPDNSMISRQTTQDRNMMMSSRAQFSSTSSLGKKSLTPVPTTEDNKYFKVHLRSPSEASSITAKQTPSTTASSSPANMKAVYKSQMQNEIIQEPESISIHELHRQADVAESQCSQTESEAVQQQNRHNLELSYSMHDSAPGAVGSISSSVQSSHQSIPSGVSNPSLISHTNMMNGTSNQSLPITGGNTMLNGACHPLHSSSQRIVMRPPGVAVDGHNEVGITRIPASNVTAGRSGDTNFIMV